MPVDVSSDEMEVSSKGSNDSGDSASGEPSTPGNQACPPRSQGAPESQSLLTDTWAGPSSRPSVPTSASETGERTPNEEHAGGQNPDAERSNTVDRRVSKRVSNALNMLLSVFEEMMESYDCKRLCELFLRDLGSARRHEDLNLLLDRLEFFIDQMETSVSVKCSCMSPDSVLEHFMQVGFTNLFDIVVSTITCTWSAENSRDLKEIMDDYQESQSFYRRYLKFWRKRQEHMLLLDEVSRNKVECLKKITEKVMLQTRNAFRELLMHVGENAEDISVFEAKVSGEDLKCLRREIVRLGEDVAEETDSREGSSEETDSREGSSEETDSRGGSSGNN